MNRFNPAPPTVLHIDLNSCFATIEQQANPRLRGKPVAVAAYTTPRGCILAASVEAKRFGVKTGMQVWEGRELCPNLIVLSSDPDKYRFVNRKLLALLHTYRTDVEVKSIDEMVMKMNQESGIMNIAREIKQRIKAEIGEWLTVSIGISTNMYLAKVASNLHKPDGLDVIWHKNIEDVLAKLELEELPGIKEGYGARLRSYGISTVLSFYKASEKQLSHAFVSKIGYDWWLMLHGWESDLYNRSETRTVGHSFALPKAYAPSDPQLHQILCQLVLKMGRRLRQYGFLARGIHISCYFANHTYWNHGEKHIHTLIDNRDLYREALRILRKAPNRPVRLLAVSCFSLTQQEQLTFWGDSHEITRALDSIADRWGEFSVIPARMLSMPQKVLDRIAFGGIKGLDKPIPTPLV